jgi:hypothetical protein
MVANMQTTMLRYALSAGLAGMLTISAAGAWLGPVRPGAEAARQVGSQVNQVSQYCIPPEEHPNSPRFYCQNGPG